MGFKQQPQCSWETSTLQVERVPSNSTAETLCRTVGMYLPPHTLSSCLHTVNYPTVSRASITQFPPGSVHSDSFVSPVSGSSLPPRAHCVSSGPHQHFSRNNQFINLQTVLSLHFVQPPFKVPSTLQGDLFKGNSDVVSLRSGNDIGPFPSGSIHTSQTPLNHLQTQRSRPAAPGPLHSLCILPGTMAPRAASSFGSPPSLLKRHLLCGKAFA